MVQGLASSHLGSSRLCGDSSRLKKERLLARQITTESLLAHGPRGGPGSPQAIRHDQIVSREAYLRDSAERFQNTPAVLHKVLSQEAKTGTPGEHYAESRLAEVLLKRVKHKFLETALTESRSPQRAEKMQNLRAELAHAKPLGGRLRPEQQEQFRQFQVDTDALEAISRAESLQHQAHAIADAQAELLFRSAPKDSPEASPGGSAREGAEGGGAAYPSRAGSAVGAQAGSAAGSGTICKDGAMERKRLADMDREMELDKQRAVVVKEAMNMLRTWKAHSTVALALCDALLSMATTGGEEALLEMERGGLAVVASTVADIHSDRCEVARTALRLLCCVSVELLVAAMEDQKDLDTTVSLGLEALNRSVKTDQAKLDELAKYGGRELLDDLEPAWRSHKMISLHILNLRRRLRRTTVKSIKIRDKVALPPEDVVKLRETFDAVDVEKSGSIGKHQLDKAMKLLKIQHDEADVDQAICDIDLDGSGLVEWPEFLFLMSKFGTNFSIENQFSEERLAEMKGVFQMFDADNSGTLDLTELKSVMTSIGLALEDWELRSMIAEVDDDGSGTIDWGEFLYLMSKKTVDAENQQQLAFEFFLEPKDRSGKIKKERFISQVQKLTKEFSKETLEAMIVQAKCEDHDLSTLSYKEFVKMMMS